ncbi:MAG: hypothetical protein H6706_21500 [Myxococcales bacterium]|nr:hypothetical protein [Myxococcales bacterium]
MSQAQGNQKRRGRSRSGGGGGGGGNGSGRPSRHAEFQARIDPNATEDSATFWARSNARLGVPAPAATSGRRSGGRAIIECQCAVCGTDVMYDRTPKHRHEVMCDACRQAINGMLRGEERQAADQVRRATQGSRKQRYDGIPEFTAEDLEALADMRAKRDIGNGRVGNRRGPESGGSRGPRRPTSGGGGGGGGNAEGDGEGGRRRRRKRRGREDGGGDDAPASEGGGGEE